MPIVTWTPTRDAVAAKLPTLSGAVRDMGQDFVKRLETTGAAYDNGMSLALISARATWSAAYGAAWAAADAEAVSALGGAPLPFDDRKPPAALVERLEKAISLAPNVTAARTLRAYASTVEAAYNRSDTAWGLAPSSNYSGGLTPEMNAKMRKIRDGHQSLRTGGKVFNVEMWKDFYPPAENARREAEMMKKIDASEAADIEAAALEFGVTAAALKAGRRAGVPAPTATPSKLTIEHTLLSAMAEADEWLAIVG